MNRIKFTDWQDMALKKDVESIQRKLDSHESVFFSMCWEIVIGIGVLIADHLFDLQRAPLGIWITVAGLAIAPALIILLYKAIRWYSLICQVRRGKYSTKHFVDLFDNQICYLVMTSNSYAHLLQGINDNSIKEKVFAYQEGCYYNNKAIDLLYKTKPVVDKVFSESCDEICRQKVVALRRLTGILDMMNSNFLLLNTSVSNMAGHLSIKEQKNVNDRYRKNLNEFIAEINEVFKNLGYKHAN